MVTEIRDKTQWKTDIDHELIDFSGHMASQICNVLHRNQIISVLIEGGGQTLQTFIDADLWDEARVFKGQKTFGKGTKAPFLPKSKKWIKSQLIEGDTLTMYGNDQ